MAFAYPDEQSWWNGFRVAFLGVLDDAGRPILTPRVDWDAFKWWTRPAYSIGTGMEAHVARTRHLRELEAALGIDPLPVDGGAPVVGYPDEGRDEWATSWWNDQRDAILARYAAAGRQPFPVGFDLGLFKCWSRTAYDIGAGLSPDAAKAKHLSWLASQLRPPTIITGRVPRPLVGPLRVANKLFHDDTGLRSPLFCSWFPALRILRDNPAECDRQLDVIAQSYQGVRIFLAVGGWMGFWDGREVAPIAFRKWHFNRDHGGHLSDDRTRPGTGAVIDAWPDYDEILRTFARACRSRDLRLDVTFGDMQIISPDPADEWLLHARVSRILADEGGTDLVALAEATNEYPINRYGGDSAASIRQMGRLLDVWRAAIPGVLTAQGAGLSEEPDVLSASSTHGEVCAQHTSRSPFELCLKRTLGLVYWEGDYRAFPKPFWQTEPAGPGDDSYQRVDDPASLTALYAMHRCSGQASNYFNGPAVRSRAPLESTWGFRELPILLADHLPEDLPAWDHGSNRRGGIEYWWRDGRFVAPTFVTWDPSPPRPVAEWTLIAGDDRRSGTGTPPPVTGVLIGRFL